jgi:hypothetical protein
MPQYFSNVTGNGFDVLCSVPCMKGKCLLITSPYPTDKRDKKTEAYS